MVDSRAAVADALALLKTQWEQGVAQVTEVLDVHETQLAELAAALAESSEPEPPPERVGAPAGMVRFFSPSKSLGVWMTPFSKMIVDGTTYHDRGRKLEWENGILDLDADDPAVAFLRSHPENGRDFVEDALAEPHRGPEVREGPRTTKQPKPSALVAADGLAAKLERAKVG